MLDDGAREGAAQDRFSLQSGTLSEERARLASDEEDVVRDKDALSRDRSLYRWWLLNEDNNHLRQDQSRLSQDYETYSRDSNSGPPIFDRPE